MTVLLNTIERERLAALDDYRLLEDNLEDDYDDVVRLAAYICGTPIAAVSLVDAQKQWFKAAIGLGVTETPRDVAFCAHTILQPDLLIVQDAQDDPRFAGNPLVTEDPNIRFYAGAPLVTSDGFALGSLCVIDRVPRILSAKQKGVLAMLARHVASRLELKRLLAVQETDLKEAQERADTDPLTGLLNHRAFHKKLEEESARAGRKGTALAVVMLDLDNFKFFNDCYGHVMGDRVLLQVAERLRAISRTYDTLARFGGDEFSLLLPDIGAVSRVELETRLQKDLSTLSFRPNPEHPPIPVGVPVGVSLFTGDALTQGEALQQADARMHRSKVGGDFQTEADRVRIDAAGAVAGFSMLNALVTAVDNKDRYTRRHSEDVLVYSLQIARELGMDDAQQQTISVAALLHDVGKIGVPDFILRKPGALTPDEFAAVQQHPAMGAIMVGAVTGLEDILDAVRHHHERWDGGGYPAGLLAEACPLIAHLMAVADAYSAMTTDRPYRQGMSAQKASAILAAGAGTQWDPACVSAFARAGRANPRT